MPSGGGARLSGGVAEGLVVAGGRDQKGARAAADARARPAAAAERLAGFGDQRLRLGHGAEP
eukprot:CAMPEP_0119269418 /NCGR_PEP_ID=MMETSP1329-20130426/6842_1 /TAXON_ID=114041 /ORGANISM="Genus nov. species nov., Strain RCC1024" /LENGTH=61 /DNA_ID=CAMNT_0007269417 /DNA_START=205 /DNA_END=387 /DNA_ORIENTATION=-